MGKNLYFYFSIALAVMLIAENAYAACTPTSGTVSPGDNVNCNGTTNDQDGANGYGTGAENDLNINISGSSSVIGTDNGFQIDSGNTITNSGTITGTNFIGIYGNANNIIINSGDIISTGGGFNGRAIRFTQGNNTVTNSGNIISSTIGIYTQNISGTEQNNIISNSGTISGASLAGVYLSSTHDIINNSGMITGYTGLLSSGESTIINTGTIHGDGIGIDSGINMNVTNYGEISSDVGIGLFVSNNSHVINNGLLASNSGIAFSTQTGTSLVNNNTITGSFFGVMAEDHITIINNGSITGSTAISSPNSIFLTDPGGANIVNNGLINGTGGIAIDFEDTPDNTITFGKNSRIIGDIHLGTNDTLNFNGGNKILNFGGSSAATTATINSNGAALAVNANTIAILDQTAINMENKALFDITRNLSSMLEPRQENVSNETSFWLSTSGSHRFHDNERTVSAATHDFAAIIVGADKNISTNLGFGGYIGTGTGRQEVSGNIQDIDSDYILAGIYGRYLMGKKFLDFSMDTGISQNDTERTTAVSNAPNGLDITRADYKSVFISPELGIGYNLEPVEAYNISPTARLRYVKGWMGSYKDAYLKLDTRDTDAFEARVGLDLSRNDDTGTGVLNTKLKFGFMLQQRLSSDYEGRMAGINFSSDLPGDKGSFGGYGSIGANYSIANGPDVYADINTIALDNDISFGAKLGIALKF